MIEFRVTLFLVAPTIAVAVFLFMVFSVNPTTLRLPPNNISSGFSQDSFRHKMSSYISNTTSYYVHPSIKAKIDNSDSKALGIRPTLLLSLQNDNASPLQVIEQIEQLMAQDDVLGSDFLVSELVIQEPAKVKLDTKRLIRRLQQAEISTTFAWKLQEIHRLLTYNDKNRPRLPDGPYFLVGDEIHEAWRLYPDHYEAFQTTIVPTTSSPYSFEILDRVATEGAWKAIAVPSRLYYTVTLEKPFAGLRVAIKDLFKIAGIRTSLNVRSFLETYGPEHETATYVKQLIDLGAVIVGKTRMTAFATGEKAPENWIDFQCPFNPRADGYQAPGGSTTGGAAALAGYEWLDYSIGSDTYGSIREPAAIHGLIGLRATTGVGDMQGVYTESPPFDTLGLLGRDLEMFHTLASNTLDSALKQYRRPVTRILYPTDWLPTDDGDQQTYIDGFVKALEESLGTQKEDINLAELWLRFPPPEGKGKSLQNYLNTTGYNPFYYDCYHEYDQFREDHLSKFGTPAYVGPHMRYIWGLGVNITADERARSMEEVEVFREWFRTTVLKTTFDPSSGNDKEEGIPIIVLPVGSATPVYRDVLSGPFQPRLGLERMNFASLLSLPQLVVPIGQSGYHSRITDRTEYLPIVGSVSGPPGSDLVLIDVVKKALTKAGYKTTVGTGRLTFS